MLLTSNHTIKLFGESKCLDYSKNLMDKISKKIYMLALFYSTVSLPAIDVYLFLDEKKYNDFVKDKFDYVEEYTKASCSDDKIAILCDEEKLKKSTFHYANVFAHMYSHILFKSLYPDEKMRPLWLDEGLAQIISGEKNKLEKEDVFKRFLMNKIFNNDVIVPLISYLKEHGDDNKKFDSKEFNGYAVSYLLVRFLFVSYGSLIKIITSKNNMEDFEQFLISRVYNYYGAYLNLPGWKINISDIKDPIDLYNYLDLYITHGWIDNDGNRHEHSLEGIRDKYRINSLDLMMQSKLATCIEQTAFEQKILGSLGYETKILCDRQFESGSNQGKVKLHVFCIFKDEDYWCYFEHAKTNKRGIHYFNDLDSLLECYLKSMSSSRLLSEIPSIPEGLTISEFNEYINEFPIIDKGLKSNYSSNFNIKR